MNGIEIRLANLEDQSLIEAVPAGVFDYDIKPPRTREFLEDERHHLVLAVTDGKIVGMASAFHYVHPDKEPSLFINEVGVLSTFHNRGIGRTMVKTLHEHARVLGCEEVWIATERSNTPARRAYAAAGGKEDDEDVVGINFE